MRTIDRWYILIWYKQIYYYYTEDLKRFQAKVKDLKWKHYIYHEILYYISSYMQHKYDKKNGKEYF